MTQNILKSLEDFCIGTAEAESAFLKEVFVDSGRYSSLINSTPGSPRLLVGRKGSGKSAILKQLENNAQDAGVTVIYLKPDDLITDSAPIVEDIASLKKFYFNSLINTIAIKYGKEMRGLIVNHHEKKLFDKALHEGHRGHDFVQISLQTVSKWGSVLTQIDFNKLIPQNDNPQIETLRQAIKDKIQRSGSKVFFLLIDDIDQVSAPGSQINRIWGFLLACRKFCEEVQSARCFISIRTEVWKLLCNDKQGQRDQVDHFQRLIYPFDPTDEEIGKIIARRLKYVAKIVGKSLNEEPYNVFFESQTMNLPFTENEQRPWKTYLIQNSRNRPRDAIQLLALLAKESNEKGYPKISDKIATKAAQKYSEERFDQLDREYALDCSVCGQIIRDFSGQDFIMEAEVLKSFLATMPSKFGIIIRGQSIHPSNDEDIFHLWNFLYEIGFINPSILDPKKEKANKHIRFEEDPRFVSKSNWNEMQGVHWEIHPCYRAYLISLRDSKKFTLGKLWSKR